MQPLTQDKIDAFVAGVQAKITAYYTKEYPRLVELEMVPVISYMMGKKNVRIVKSDNSSRAAFCFLDLATGIILKPAGWNAPAKGGRGHVWTDTHGVEFVSVYGAAYNR